ncbi:MAG: hypothetical protein IJT56_04820 [Clostridia bacterium]|nr:hypothetical protein [Clostridia bacterium]
MTVNALSYLRSVANDIIGGCTFEKDTAYLGENRKRRLLLPSGDEKYGSFWLRDCAMMTESGLIPDDTLKEYLLIFASHGQNGGDGRELKNGLYVPPYALCDHLNYDGGAVFYPGTYSSGDDQGDGRCGFLPPLGDNYYFILMARQYIRQSGDRGILYLPASGMPLITRLEKAFGGYCVDPKTGLCVTDMERRAVDWGFCDTMIKTGYLLMPSILRFNAAKAMAEMTDDPEKKERYLSEREKIRRSVLDLLYDGGSGWLWSASGVCRQHDVWATAYAVYSGVLDGDESRLKKTLSAIRNGYISGSAVRNGAVRHILTDEDCSSDSAWEMTGGVKKGTYQNGGWWPTATGWYIYSLRQADMEAAISCLRDHIAFTAAGRADGTPYEWFNPDTGERSGLRYGTSAALPYAAAKRLAMECPEAAEITAEI